MHFDLSVKPFFQRMKKKKKNKKYATMETDWHSIWKSLKCLIWIFPPKINKIASKRSENSNIVSWKIFENLCQRRLFWWFSTNVTERFPSQSSICNFYSVLKPLSALLAHLTITERTPKMAEAKKSAGDLFNETWKCWPFGVSKKYFSTRGWMLNGANNYFFESFRLGDPE